MPSYDLIATNAVGPVMAELSDACNDCYEARRRGDRARIGRLEAEVRELLARFIATEAPGLFNPPWSIANARANWAFARGRYDEAYAHDLDGWKHAWDLDRAAAHPDRAAGWRAITANNLANSLLKLGRFEDARHWARFALDLDPDNPVRRLMLAIAEHRAGDRAAGDVLLDALLRETDFDDDRDPVAACMELETELHSIDSPATRRIVAALRGAGRLPEGTS
jgi:tetratricopeptide (TPR) repeat protein